MTGREKCLKEALDIVTGSRDKKYGKPEDNFKRIVNHWQTHLNNRHMMPNIAFDQLDVALMMVGLKLARIEGNPYDEDSYIDAVGYLACAYEMILEEGGASDVSRDEI